MTEVQHHCGFCRRRLPTVKGLRLHVQNSPRCCEKWERQLTRISKVLALARTDNAAAEAVANLSNPAVSPEENANNMQDIGGLPTVNEDPDDPMDGTWNPYRTQVEDVTEDEELARRYVEDYPGVVASIIREDDTLFERWCAMRMEAEVDEWAPFKDEDEWELFRWLIKHVGQNRIDEFLKLSIVRD